MIRPIISDATNEEQLLPLNFVPGSEHVVINQGSKYCKHSGNLHLRRLAQSKLSMYVKATCRSAKSSIISDVIKELQSTSTYGGFVRHDKDIGRWVTAEESLVREKTSQAFRDALRQYYKSSRANKRKYSTADLNSDEEGTDEILERSPQRQGVKSLRTSPPMVAPRGRELATARGSWKEFSLSSTLPPQPSAMIKNSCIVEKNDNLQTEMFSLKASSIHHDAMMEVEDHAATKHPFEPIPLLGQNIILNKRLESNLATKPSVDWPVDFGANLRTHPSRTEAVVRHRHSSLSSQVGPSLPTRTTMEAGPPPRDVAFSPSSSSVMLQEDGSTKGRDRRDYELYKALYLRIIPSMNMMDQNPFEPTPLPLKHISTINERDENVKTDRWTESFLPSLEEETITLAANNDEDNLFQW